MLLILVQVWRKEAFDLWIDLWASLYPDESRSSGLLHDIHDTYSLVAIINNNFFEVRWYNVVCISAQALLTLVSQPAGRPLG